MAADEILHCARFYVTFDNFSVEKLVKKVSGLAITLEVAGDTKPFGVKKGGVAAMQATVTGVSNGKITVEYVAQADDTELVDWYMKSHAGPMMGGKTELGGERYPGAITLYNQAGEEAAQWKITGAMPASYKTSKLEPGSTELMIETVEVVYENLHRVK